MYLLLHFCHSKMDFHQLGPFDLIKTMLKSLKFCKVYHQHGIVILRVVTIHGLPSIQVSRMMNSKIEFAKNKCMGTIWSHCLNLSRKRALLKRLFPVT